MTTIPKVETEATTKLTFGDAVAALKVGKRVSRPGWNGAGMWLVLVKPTAYDVGVLTLGPTYNEQKLAPWIGMKTAQKMFTPWAPSQSDVLAEDWMIVEDVPTFIPK